MSVARAPLGRIVVAGSGQVAALAALALRQALPQADLRVIVTSADPGAIADRVETALGFTNRLHDRLGIDEQQMVQKAGASHRLVLRYRGWAGPGSDRVVAIRPPLPQAMRNALDRVLDRLVQSKDKLQGHGAGGARSIAEALARAGHFSPPWPGQAMPIVDVDYGLRWNGESYLALLTQEARQSGIRHHVGDVMNLELDTTGTARALVLTSGERLEAELFIDATGPRADVLSRMRGWAWQDWQAMLPVRQLALVRGGSAAAALFDTVALTAEGWVAETAGLQQSQAFLGVAGNDGAAAAVRLFKRAPDEILSLSPGRQRHAWLSNVVGLGDASACFEPLGWLNLDLAHRQLDLLLEYLPGQVIVAAERAEYNRRAALMADRARDVVASHYAAKTAATLYGALTVPAELAVVLDQFERRGLVGFEEEAPLTAPERAELFQALGLPAGVSALEHAIDPDVIADTIARERAAQRSAVLTAPPYAAWLRQAASKVS